MTHYITARSNDRAKLIHKTATTSCADMARIIARMWREDGFDVLEATEG
jgi:hypothetical protein